MMAAMPQYYNNEMNLLQLAGKYHNVLAVKWLSYDLSGLVCRMNHTLIAQMLSNQPFNA